MNQVIKTISTESEFKFKEKGSQFIAKAYHVQNFEEAEKILAELKKEFYDATHHCYAFEFGNENFRYSDDGEPNGTAGVRILNAIQHFDLVNIFVCVIRYYGGTKLGVGPLGKAYYEAAFGAIENANIVQKELLQRIQIFYDYQFTSHVHHFLSFYSAKELKNKFDREPVIECLIAPENVIHIEEDLRNLSSGKVKVAALDEYIYQRINLSD